MSNINRIEYTIDHYTEVDNGRLKQHLIQHLENPTAKDIEDSETFVTSYLGFVVPTLQHLEHAANQSNYKKVIETIIEDCVEYFRKSNDHINDYQTGLYGLMDDAYRTMTLVSAIQQTVSGLNLPFESQKLIDLNNSARWLLPKDAAKKIDVEVLQVRGKLLLGEIKNWTSQQQQKVETSPVTLTNGKYNFTFKAFELKDSLASLKGRKGIYFYSRRDNENGKFIHKIIYMHVTSDLSTINLDKEKLEHVFHIKNYSPTHIGVYDDSQNVENIKAWAISLLEYYKPPINYKTNQQQNTTIKKPTTRHSSSPHMQKKNCSTCHGSGKRVCSSCGGRGGRYESRVDYDWEGRPNYRDEWINCYSCSGGYATCFVCGGKGEVFA